MARKFDKRIHTTELAVGSQLQIPSPLRNFQSSRLNDYIQIAIGKSLNGIFRKLCLHFYVKNDRFTIKIQLAACWHPAESIQQMKDKAHLFAVHQGQCLVLSTQWTCTAFPLSCTDSLQRLLPGITKTTRNGSRSPTF